MSETQPTSESPSGGPIRPGPRRFSIAGRLAGILAAGLALFVVLTWAGSLLPIPIELAGLISFGVALTLVVWAVGRVLRPLNRTLQALSDGIRSFRDHDFSVRLATTRTDELGELVDLYNLVGGILQEERGQIRQRELLLQSAMDQSPIAIILVNPLERVIYANAESRRLFFGGGRMVGWRFIEILEHCPAELRQMIGEGRDGIFSVETGDLPETYHLAERGFYLNRQRHRLFLLRRMTSELARQEAEIWKKVIRIISHELNNSLAPISSLAHSAQLIAKKQDQLHRLEEIHGSIRERVDHLTRFLEGYARFARLPRPKRREVDWEEWLGAPREMYDFAVIGDLPEAPGYFDPSQMQQALINLLKNAAEASDGSPEIALRVDRLPDGRARLQVLDRGRGMREEVMRQALLPFYSTKPSGTGVGLPLCREIVEAHGGSIRIQSREGGGTIVSLWLPPRRETIPA